MFDIYGKLVYYSETVTSINGVRRYIMAVDTIYLKLVEGGGG